MPDYTDPYLFPFPTEEEFGDGANGLEEMARAVDARHAAEVARLTALGTRPTVIRRRASNQATGVGTSVINFSTSEHNNFGAVDFVTPAVGAHPVAGVYPALWRFDAWIHFIGTAPVGARQYDYRVNLRQALPGETFVRTTRFWIAHAREGLSGGEYITLNGAALLSSPGSFTNEFFAGVAGNVQTNSWMSLTRIRSV